MFKLTSLAKADKARKAKHGHQSRKKLRQMLKKQKRLLQKRLDEEFKAAIKQEAGADRPPVDKSHLFIGMKTGNMTQIETVKDKDVKQM